MLIVLASSLASNGRPVSGVSAGSSASVVRPSFAAGSGDAEALRPSVPQRIPAWPSLQASGGFRRCRTSGVSELSGSEVSVQVCPRAPVCRRLLSFPRWRFRWKAPGASSAKTVVPKARKQQKNGQKRPRALKVLRFSFNLLIALLFYCGCRKLTRVFQLNRAQSCDFFKQSCYTE